MKRQDIEEVMQGIYRIPVPLEGNPLKELNSYLIRGGQSGSEHNLLVDTGFHTVSCRRAVEEGLELLGLSMDNTDILVTHLLADHSGNAPELVRGNNRVYMSEVDCRYMMRSREDEGKPGVHTLQKMELIRHGVDRALIEEMLEATPSRKLAGDLRFTAYTQLREGDKIKVGPYTLKAILTPGHTPGQMCFEIEGTGAMILGDHVLFDITPNITNWPDVEDSLGDYLSSLDKVDGYNVVLPLPGHRKPGDFHGRIASLKRHHERRLTECCTAIGALKRARLYDIAGLMTWKIRANGWEDFPAPQRWFALGECMAHLDHLQRMGRVRRHEDEMGYWYEI